MTKPFTKRLAQADSAAEIRALLAEAAEMAREARAKSDLQLLRLAVEHERRAQRRGGELLGKGIDHDGLGEQQAQRWRSLARMSGPQFEATLAGVIARVSVTGGAAARTIKMKISAWHLDENGNRCRTVTAADDAEPKSSR